MPVVRHWILDWNGPKANIPPVWLASSGMRQTAKVAGSSLINGLALSMSSMFGGHERFETLELADGQSARLAANSD